MQKGFTLVELAIALMVIGLLIGGVLKGQELIENARITSTIRQIKAYDAATMIFRNTYGALPGDIKRPNRIPNCIEEICTLAGNGNGKINITDTSPNGIERHNFFPHMTKAGMISGPVGGTLEQMNSANIWVISDESSLFFPVAAIDTAQIYVQNLAYAVLPLKHYYVLLMMSGKRAAALDSKMDDGDGQIGSVVVEDGADCLIGEWPDLEYDSVNGNCGMLVEAGF